MIYYFICYICFLFFTLSKQNNNIMNIEQITRKVRDWSVIRDRALKGVVKYQEERKRYAPHFTTAIVSCVEKIDKYERIAVYAEVKLHDCAELLFSETL